MRSSNLLLLAALSGCTAAPVILAEPLPEALAPESEPEPQGQLLLPPVGYCVEYTISWCSPDDGTARAMCARLYGDAFAELYGTTDVTAVECWQSIAAAAWGCLPACGHSITCPGAEEVPSALWCCPG